MRLLPFNDPVQSGRLFVWRQREFYGLGATRDFAKPNLCDVCGEPRVLFRRGGLHLHWSAEEDRLCICPLCGWEYRDHQEAEPEHDSAKISFLKECCINGSEIALDELGTHLKRRREDVYLLSARRFEIVVADVFKTHGFRVILTAQSRDNGADIVLLHNERNDATAIVECKRYASNRPVGVSLVRYLAGAAIDWEVNKAYLVTTSSFSSIAHKKVMDYARRGIEIELIAMSELAMLLGVYNTKLPPLSKLTSDERRQIVASSLPGIMRHHRVESTSSEERVRKRAYDIYCQRIAGRWPVGPDLDDWLRAEREIQAEDSGEYGFPMS